MSKKKVVTASMALTLAMSSATGSFANDTANVSENIPKVEV